MLTDRNHEGKCVLVKLRGLNFLEGNLLGRNIKEKRFELFFY